MQYVVVPIKILERGLSSDLEVAGSISDIFEVVKSSVQSSLGLHRGGLMLGIADLGGGAGGHVGAYYPVASNIIVVNKRPLESLTKNEPSLYKPYVFHILLHEYLHSLDVLDEMQTRRVAFEVSRKSFGDSHVATKLAANIGDFLANITYAHEGWQPQGDASIEIVMGFDKETRGYIS